MNKLIKIFLGIIIVLSIALIIMSILYFDMRSKARKNLNDFLNKCEETTNLYNDAFENTEEIRTNTKQLRVYMNSNADYFRKEL